MGILNNLNHFEILYYPKLFSSRVYVGCVPNLYRYNPIGAIFRRVQDAGTLQKAVGIVGT